MTETATRPHGTGELFTPLRLGRIPVANRIVMAPLTRNRARADGVPTTLMARYYADRATTGLIITEGTHPSRRAQSFPHQPGITGPAEVAGWRQVSDAVHAAGGRMVLQLMHGGRISHPETTGGRQPVAPSALAAPGELRTPAGMAPHPLPRELRITEMPEVVAEFVDAAHRAVAAGLDGVEVHGANGYLLNQFLSPTSNRRTDAYGGSPRNRARLVVEVVRAVANAVGADRTGLRLSPGLGKSGTEEPDPADRAATYAAVVDALAGEGLAYLHLLGDPRGDLLRDLRRRFGGPVIVNSGFAAVTSLEEAAGYLAEGLAEAVAVGRPVLANPDLVRRWAEGLPLNQPDPATFYGGDERGYTDYPAFGA